MTPLQDVKKNYPTKSEFKELEVGMGSFKNTAVGAGKCWMGRMIWWFRWREQQENLWCLVHVGCLDESSTAGVHREAFVHRADNDLINMQRQIKAAEQRHRKNRIWCLGVDEHGTLWLGVEASVEQCFRCCDAAYWCVAQNLFVCVLCAHFQDF